MTHRYENYLKLSIPIIDTNMVLRTILGRKMDEVTREWWKLHNEELNDLYSSHITVRVIKSRRIGWTGQMALKGERCKQGFGGETWEKEVIWKTQK